MNSIRKYFTTSTLKTELPVWFRKHGGIEKITLLTVHCPQLNEDHDISVHSNMAMQGSCEYSYGHYNEIVEDEDRRQAVKEDIDRNFCYVCYANETRFEKTFEINRQFDDLEFWLIEGGEKINEPKWFRAEMVLELTKH
jgi:hypothetical protein